MVSLREVVILFPIPKNNLISNLTTKNTEYKILIMNRHERRKLKSKKGGRYRGLKRPTDDGVANGGKKTYG